MHPFCFIKKKSEGWRGWEVAKGGREVGKKGRKEGWKRKKNQKGAREGKEGVRKGREKKGRREGWKGAKGEWGGGPEFGNMVERAKFINKKKTRQMKHQNGKTRLRQMRDN